MNKIKKRYVLLYAGLLLFLICLSAYGIQAKAADKEGRILFISSYSYSWETVQRQISGVEDRVGNNIVVDYEFMDTKRINDEVSSRQFYEGLAYRLSKVEPYDAVILGDDPALLFGLKYRDELFDGIPLIFEGVNDTELAISAAQDPMITGIIEKLSIANNIELGMKLNPSAKKVAVILDNSITGMAVKREYYRYAREYPELEFTDINASELTLNQLRQKISMVGKNTILIYVLMTENASGKQYSEKEAIHFIMNNAKVPVFSMLEGGIGDGFIGGNVASMYKSGEIAAEIAVGIINGAKISGMGVKESPNIYCIDQLVVKKFGLTMPDMPENSEIINYQPAFLERNKEVVIPAAVLIFTMLSVVCWAMYDNLKRRKLMEELEEARKIMEAASQHDFLTGLGNRSKFMEDIENLIDTHTPCSIMMLDIDHFKYINDTYGHTAGDEALKQLAERLKGMQTPILTPYRFAGDEFIIILKSSQNKIKEKSAVQCHQLFGEPFMLAGEKRKVGGSIGIASYPADAGSIEQLIICADDAMYQVKKSGRNNFAFYKTDGNETQENENGGSLCTK